MLTLQINVNCQIKAGDFFANKGKGTLNSMP